MNKKFFKVTGMFLASVSLFSMVGCGVAKDADGQTDLTIKYLRAGWGDVHIKQIVENFKKEYPQYNVQFTSSPTAYYHSEIDLGGKYNSTDLYITSMPMHDYTVRCESVDDVFSYKHDGESLTIGEKIHSSMMYNIKAKDGHYYGVPAGDGGHYAIIYNADIINGTDYKVPNTTDELEDLTYDLLADGKTPFIHYGTVGGYWDYLQKAWQVQYDGFDYYMNTFLELKEEGKEGVSKNVLLKKDGRYETIKMLERIISTRTTSIKSMSSSHTEAQTYFMNGEAVMMANGNWLLNEMKNNTEAKYNNFAPMRMPVLSSIRINQTTTLESDRELSRLIDAIDAVLDTTGKLADVPLEGNGYSVNEADMARIFEARSTTLNTSDASLMVIPKYATAKDAAKDFMKFYYKDESIKVLSDIMHVAAAANVSVDTTGWNNFEITYYKHWKTSNYIGGFMVGHTSSMFLNGATAYGGDGGVVNQFNLSTGRKTADEVWGIYTQSVNEQWGKWLLAADMKDANT